MNLENVSLVIPTRGDVDLSAILSQLPPFGEVLVWNNSERADLGIYARYEMIGNATNQVIATQDDDLIVTCWAQIAAAYQPDVLTVNYPEPWDIPWVARGAIFDRDLPDKAFDRYLAHYPLDQYFTHWACDGIFGLLTKHVNVIDEGSEDLSYANDGGRVSTSGGWYDDKRPTIQARCQAVRDAQKGAHEPTEVSTP